MNSSSKKNNNIVVINTSNKQKESRGAENGGFKTPLTGKETEMKVNERMSHITNVDIEEVEHSNTISHFEKTKIKQPLSTKFN
jgi:hypothetical protein